MSKQGDSCALRGVTVFFAVMFAAGGESQKRKEGMSISLPLIRRIDGSNTQYEVVDFSANVITPEHAARMQALRDELQKKGREAVIAGLASRAALRTTIQEKRTFDLSISSFPCSSLIPAKKEMTATVMLCINAPWPAYAQ